MRKIALLVGVEQYSDAAITPLQYANSDVTALRRQLINRCGFNQVCTLAENSPDGEPKLLTILNAFRNLAGELRPDDQFLFYFAGHGIEKDGQGYLFTYDSSQAFPEMGSLPLKVLRETFQRLAAGQRMIVLDACRNAPDAARGDSGNPMGEKLSRDIVTVARADTRGCVSTGLLLSCQPGQRAYEWAAKQHGVFTHYLLEGLKGAAWEGNKLVFKRLASYVQREVKTWSTKTPGVSRPQEPWYEEYGDAADIVLSSKASGELADHVPVPASHRPHIGGKQTRHSEATQHRLCLEFLGAESGRKIIIHIGESFTLGRENCIRHDDIDVTVRLLPCRSPERDPANWRRTNMISRRHLAIRRSADHFEIRTLGSQSRALIQEVPDPHECKQYLEMGDLHALFCDTRSKQQDVAPRRSNKPQKQARASSSLSAYRWHQVPAQSRITLGNDIVTLAARCYGGEDGRACVMQLKRRSNRPELEYLLSTGLLYIGNDPRCPLCLTEPGIPIVLAKVERYEGAFYLTRALDSVRITIDEQEVAPLESVMISPPSRIAFGDYVCLARALEPFDFTE